MSDRPTKTLTTPSGKELVLKNYLTAGERNELRGVFLNRMKIKTAEGGSVDDVEGKVLDEAEKKLIEISVITYDASGERIYERLLEALPEEYDFVVKEANAIGMPFQKAK